VVHDGKIMMKNVQNYEKTKGDLKEDEADHWAY
jgi:major membrane immunogen (membrane-anchored lipoprotein)